MSTFAVFGMTRDVALAMAKKEVKSVRKTPLGDEHVPMSEWLAAVERKADNIMTGTKVVQLSQQIRAKVQLWNEDGTPVLTKKRKHKVEWQQFGHQPGRAAA
ncbi:hypothetical protein [Pseudomonas aeruginosa]|uniref:hypothetical protein n=1 Tax=Pseudomonas aeruginosa TaxID=287 RepID=UPI001CBDC98C|nr:hypothetical protein [Pseudomonas aeruginosa]